MSQGLTVGDLLKEEAQSLRLELVAGEKSVGRKITVSEINRPGLALSGFMDHFRPERVQLIGVGEQEYCRKAPVDKIKKTLDEMLSPPELPCLILTHNRRAPQVLSQACRQHGVPLLRSRLDTATFVSELGEVLESRLAPAARLHGVLVNIYGLGVLIQGDAGIGKSECALELLKRGHILVADDVVEVKHLRGGVLRGACPEPLRHYMEVRGLGVIDVKLLFGIGSILDRTTIGLAIQLDPWKENMDYERLGLETKLTKILGVDVPLIRIPVSPGRNLAVLIEVAALNSRLRSQGYFSAETFNRKLIERMRHGSGT